MKKASDMSFCRLDIAEERISDIENMNTSREMAHSKEQQRNKNYSNFTESIAHAYGKTPESTESPDEQRNA